MKKHASKIMHQAIKHTCSCAGKKSVGAASHRTMNAVLLPRVTTDSLPVATEEEMAATCGHLTGRKMEFPSPGNVT